MSTFDGGRAAGGASAGPVLVPGPTAEAIIDAIRALNPEVQILTRGAYLRVLVPGRCRVTRVEIERRAARPFRLPVDLEAVMPSFKGTLAMSDEEVVWDALGGGPG